MESPSLASTCAKIDDKINNYNISLELDKFNEETHFRPIGMNKCKNFALSFITHAAGLYLFYSPNVKTRYLILQEEKKRGNRLKGRFENSTNFLAWLMKRNETEQHILKGTTNSEKRSLNFGDYKAIRFVYNIENSDNVFLRSETIHYMPNDESLTYKQIFDDKIYESLPPGHKPANNIFFYHLFGYEAMINPSAFIHNKMALDLIENKILGWRDALVGNAYGGELPMSTEGEEALMGARVINSIYIDFMPYPYLYDAEYLSGVALCVDKNERNNYEEYAYNLLVKEINITAKWLEWKLGKNVSDYMIKKCCRNADPGASDAIWGLILESCLKWYPGVLR
jgi:hypothetical protein